MKNNPLLINEPPLQVLPSLAVKIGLNEAIFVQQLHYLLRISKNQRDDMLWVFKTFDEWHTEHFPFWSVPTIRRIVKSLRSQKVIKTTSKYNRLSIDRTLWYAIDYRALISSVEVINVIASTDQIDHMSSDQFDHVSTNKDKTTTTEETEETHTEEIVQDDFKTFVEFWAECFPEKSKPRTTNTTLRAKFNARMKERPFVENWKNALKAAAESATLVNETWFKPEFFLRNDNNYSRCLDREWAWKDKQYAAMKQRQNATIHSSNERTGGAL